MVSVFEIIVYIFLLFFIIGAIIFTIILIFKQREIKEKFNIQTNAPFVENYLAHRTGGYFLGLFKDKILGRDNREIIEYLPIDINEEGDIELLSLKTVKVPVDKNKIEIIPQSRGSKRRAIMRLYPLTPQELDYYFDDGVVKEGLQRAIIMKDIEKSIFDMIEEGQAIRKDLLIKFASGELSRMKIKLDEDWLKSKINLAVQEAEVKKKAVE